jgi:hypothetical protein
VKRQLSRVADPGKPPLGSGILLGHFKRACCGCVLYPACGPAAPPNLDIHLPVALDVTTTQRLQTVRSAWPAELLCQLNSHATANRRRCRRLLASSSPLRSTRSRCRHHHISRSTSSGELRAPPKSRSYRCGCNTSIPQRHCLVPALHPLVVGFVSTKPRRPHSAFRSHLTPNGPSTGLALPVSQR